MSMSRTWTVAAVLLLAAGVASAQSLGEVAEKERARRHKAQEAGVKPRSYTDKDLGRDNVGAGTFNATGDVRGATGAPREKAAAGAAGSPLVTASPSPSPTPEPPSGMEVLQRKIVEWRARYRAVKAEVDELEAVIAELTEKARPGVTGGLIVVPGSGHRPTSVIPEVDVVVKTLEQTRREHAKAKQRLEDIIEAARRDGVSYGQLY
jgi:hypothetical protein